MAEVEAADLHVERCFRFDITTDGPCIYLFEGGCGNTVARLVSSLQRPFDGALSLADQELESWLQSEVTA